MVFDISISIALAICALVSGYLGLQVTLQPPKTARKKRRYKIAFGTLSLLSVGLILWQGIRNGQAHDREMKLILGDEMVPPLVDVLVLPDHWMIVVSNEAGSSAYNVTMDLSEISPHPLDALLSRTYPEINAHTAPIVANAIPPPEGNVCLFRAMIRTRLGSYSEQIQLRRLPDGQWSRASRVMNDSGVVTHQEHSDFPRNAKGEIEWNF
jgi:hypothetical protein